MITLYFLEEQEISTESRNSGISEVQDGLYHQKYDYPPETILSHTFFMKRPEEFYKFYRDKMLCDTAKQMLPIRSLQSWNRQES